MTKRITKLRGQLAKKEFNGTGRKFIEILSVRKKK
jgi:hypothetical protein